MEKAEKRTIKETVSASGKIFPETEVKISSDVSGEITELYVKEGDSVTIGQILAKIRPDEYQSAVEQGESFGKHRSFAARNFKFQCARQRCSIRAIESRPTTCAGAA